MSKDIASIREIQHNRQLIMQALNKNTTNFSNYSKISESLKGGDLKLTLNPITDEFLFQDKKNNTVCINPTKGTLNEKPINELLLKADVDNKADKEYVDDAIAKEEERANNAYATKEYTHPELADKTYVDNKMSSEVTRAENEYSKKTHTHYINQIPSLKETLETKADKTHTHSISDITNLQETLNRKSAVGHTHTIANITNLQETLNRKSAVGHTHTIANITNLQETLNTKANKTHTHSISDITNLQETLNTKANKTHTHTSFTTFTADDITLNTTLPSKGPTIPPATSLVDTLISNDNSIMHLRQELNVLKQILPNLIYPVGSLYVSMNSTRPEVVLGFGTWTQIVDRFLYCANSSKETGGSKTISGANLPAHSHYIDLSTSQAGWHSHRYIGWSGMTKGKGYDVKDDVKFAINGYWSDTQGDGNHTHFVSGYTQTTGQSKDYMPPYMTVYAWYRNA
ncbi:Phage tail fiber repeat family protein [Trichomonas vaginalis G3]|uniref:Phage tail fiber repeat family protein n=1 Tax=Trichomonas vaginalis (strain ATCC PRA-98 / G3) TaxID=412133 RepID=A2ELZ4_TRIV3|nr:Phage tail fiber repeat family protein [Trichomonas vaginalis G3]|eukprot:XP_001318556.1 Phage tail fiber repeat family protein [Trichomonas vaginalis G3]